MERLRDVSVCVVGQKLLSNVCACVGKKRELIEVIETAFGVCEKCEVMSGLSGEN